MKKHTVAIACFVLSVASCFAADAGLPHLAFTDTRLDNGLRVILAPDHSAPVLAVNVIYAVGSRDERPGRTGFAHLFEHMMFQGSENVGKGELLQLLENNGGDFNGTTNEDRTTYYEIVPKNQMDLVLFLEADRMGKLALNQVNLDNQRNAVQEERRLGIDNQPYGKAQLEIDNLTYDCFGYKHSTIGSMADLNAANLQDVQEFFRIYYAPNNAVLSLVGDFDPAEAMEKVKKYFAGIPRQPAPPKAQTCEEDRYGGRHEVVSDPLARLPLLLMSYQIPAGNTPDNYAASVLGDILGRGKSSRFYQHLVKDKQLATDIGVQVDSRRGISPFYINATPRPGVKPEDLEKAIYEELDAIEKNGVTDSEIDTARMQLRRRIVQGCESSLVTAIRLGQYAVFYDDPDLINTMIAKYDTVTRDDVKRAAQQYFVVKERAVVIAMPDAQGGQGAEQQGGQQ